MTGDTFETLLGPNLPSVRRFVQTRLRASDYADAIIQQTLLHAFVHRDQLRATSRFKSWLCSIAMNEVRTFFRIARPTLSLDEFPHIDSRDSEPSTLARVVVPAWRSRTKTFWLKVAKATRSVARARRSGHARLRVWLTSVWGIRPGLTGCGASHKLMPAIVRPKSNGGSARPRCGRSCAPETSALSTP